VEVDAFDLSAEESIPTTTVMLRRAPVLHSAISETLRLFTSPLSVRSAPTETVLRTRHDHAVIKKGWRAVTATRSVNVDREIFGEDATTYKGDRFCAQGSLLKSRDMAPFGGGSSICSGRHFAMAELGSAIILLLQAHRFDSASAKIVDSNDAILDHPPTFDLVDLDGTPITALWAGAVADPNAAQSGVFRPKHRCVFVSQLRGALRAALPSQ
jgi:cytochrome P450